MRKIITGLALDIDETIAATNYFWIEMLTEIFGKPDDISIDEIASLYRYTQMVPFWQTEEAFAWMEYARNSNEIQIKVPLIDNANYIVQKLHNDVPIIAYVTVRPEKVRQGTTEFLCSHGFPDVPLIMRPDDVEHSDGNKWKADVLEALYPNVWGIIDDNSKLIEELSGDYNGTVFLYDHDTTEETNISVVPVKSWDDTLLEKILAVSASR